ncbi:MAG: 30S ribosomal protein S3 [Flavobacteriales endosymbiont of Rhyzopertha dominica]|nr:MAG: 30S ribosomal protein S3 [Candidatus Shikimatogenerans bostrichidophilus]
MGQKTNPISNRLGIIYGWKSLWYSNYLLYVYEDNLIREYIKKRYLNKYCISTIIIERILKKIIISICTSKPAIIIGKKGKEVEYLKKNIRNIILNNYNSLSNKNSNYYNKEFLKTFILNINVIDINVPELDSLLVASNICRQIENRISYKKAIKFAIFLSMKKKINGIKIQISGRLNGNEIARTEVYKEGTIKLSTFRANIDYSFYEANTVYGKIGVKVWIMKNEIYEIKKDFTKFYENYQNKFKFYIKKFIRKKNYNNKYGKKKIFKNTKRENKRIY